MQSQKKIIVLALGTSILLMLVKFGAYFLTSSNAILTDAAESIVNVIAGMFAFYSIYLAAQPRDSNHPYGHGKVEFFSMFVEGLLIVIAGLLIIGKSIFNLFYPSFIEKLLDGTIVVAATGVVNFIVGIYLVRQSKKYNSATLYADGRHLQADAYGSFGLVVGLLLIYATRIYYFDSLLSILLGAYIIFTGYKLIRKSVGRLMDESDFEQVSAVIAILDANRRDAWIDVHNLRTQQYGNELHIDCHITLPYYYDLNHVHEEISQVETLMNLKSSIPTEFFIHSDPCLPQCCHYCRMSECPVRTEEKTLDIPWNMEILTRNTKHFDRPDQHLILNSNGSI